MEGEKIVITVIWMQKEARDQAVWLEVRILQTLKKYLYKISIQQNSVTHSDKKITETYSVVVSFSALEDI